MAAERGVTILRHELPTNGILYADVGFDVSVRALECGVVGWDGLGWDGDDVDTH